MENLKKKLKTVHETPNAPNQSSTYGDTAISVDRLVDKSQSSSLLNDKSGTNTVEHFHHHHESLNVEMLGNSSSSKLQLNDSNEIDLDEDCLLEIFSYLSMNDMMQIKRVCKKWYQVSQQWFKRLQNLECTIYEYDIDAKVALQDKYDKREVFEKKIFDGFKDFVLILNSCGHHIKYYKAVMELDDTFNTDECVSFMFHWVPKLCKNIVDLQIDGCIQNEYFSSDETHCLYTKWSLCDMAKHWNKLEKINIQQLSHSIGNDFLELLRNNKQLTTLILSFDSRYETECVVNDKFFTCLPTTIKEIKIDGFATDLIPSGELSHFISASKNFTSLQSLNFSNLDYMSNTLIAAIAEIKSLTELSLSDVHCYESQRTLNRITNLKCLRLLSLVHYDDLHEDNIINIVESCTQLETLCIRCKNVVTERGMIAIAKLKGLKILNIDMTIVTIEPIINLCDNLEVLSCYESKMNNNDVIKLLKQATNLRILHIYSCRNITSDVLEGANEIANERKNNILCLIGSFYSHHVFDTPYFKYSNCVRNIPLKIFPENIRYYIEKFIDNYYW